MQSTAKESCKVSDQFSPYVCQEIVAEDILILETCHHIKGYARIKYDHKANKIYVCTLNGSMDSMSIFSIFALKLLFHSFMTNLEKI